MLLGGEQERAYEAFLILKAAGYGAEEIREILRKLVELGFLDAEALSVDAISELHRRGRVPGVNSPLVQALFYRECYELAVELKREHPNWGAARIAKEIRRRKGVLVPELTVYYWIAGRSKPNIAPLRVRPELALLLGYLIERGIGSGSEVKFKTRHCEVAEAARAAAGIEAKDAGGGYSIRTAHSGLRYLLSTGLWRCLQAAWPEEFEWGRWLARAEAGSWRGALGRRKIRRRAEEADPRSLTIEAIMLCNGMEAGQTIKLLREAKEYGLQIEIPSGEEESLLPDVLPGWYIPSTLYLALMGNRSHGRKPVKVCPELAELLGEYAAEVGRSPVFRSTELEHAEKFARLMAAVTGVEHEPREDLSCGFLAWKVGISTALRYLLETGLYKVIALRWPREFLRGLFDGDGSVVAWIYRGSLRFELRVTLEKGGDLAEFVKRLLEEKFGVKMAERRGHGKCVDLYCGNASAVMEFARWIGFGLERKRKRLETLLKILEFRGKARVREFLKIKGMWHEDYRPRVLES